jgi:hypothetical protein
MHRYRPAPSWLSRTDVDLTSLRAASPTWGIVKTADQAVGNNRSVALSELGCGVRSELASALGARTNDVGCLEVDAHQRTTIEGIYAAGDVVSDLHQIAIATGHAAIAAPITTRRYQRTTRVPARILITPPLEPARSAFDRSHFRSPRTTAAQNRSSLHLIASDEHAA